MGRGIIDTVTDPSFVWPGRLDGVSVSYDTGMEHNPMTRHGHNLLVLGADDVVSLDHRRAGARRGWRGRLAPGVRERVLVALRTAGFPVAVSTIDRTRGILPDSSMDTVTVSAGRGRSASVGLLSYDSAARAPYREALALLESLLVQASGGHVGFGPDVLPASSVIRLAPVRGEPPSLAADQSQAAAFVGLWLDQRGRALCIEHDLRVTIAPSVTDSCYRRSSLLGLPGTTRALPAKLDKHRLIVEAGAPGLGPTYVLEVDGAQLRPSVVMGLYDDYDDDLGVPWAFPLSPYRRAGDHELDAFSRTHRAGLVGWWRARKP